MVLKQKLFSDYLADHLPGAVVTSRFEAGQHQFVIFIPAELAAHTLTFSTDEFNTRSLDELIILLEANDCLACIETAVFSLDIRFPLGIMQVNRRPAA